MSRTVLGAGATAVALGALVALALVLGTGLQDGGWPALAPDAREAPRVGLGGAGPRAAVPADGAPGGAVERARSGAREVAAVRSAGGPVDAATLGGARVRRPRTAAGAVPAPGSGRVPTPVPEGGAGTAAQGTRPVAMPVGGEPARPVGPGDGVPRPASGAGAQPGEGGTAPGPVGGGPAPGGGPSRSGKATARRPARAPAARTASATTVARILAAEPTRTRKGGGSGAPKGRGGPKGSGRGAAKGRGGSKAPRSSVRGAAPPTVPVGPPPHTNNVAAGQPAPHARAGNRRGGKS